MKINHRFKKQLLLSDSYSITEEIWVKYPDKSHSGWKNCLSNFCTLLYLDFPQIPDAWNSHFQTNFYTSARLKTYLKLLLLFVSSLGRQSPGSAVQRHEDLFIILIFKAVQPDTWAPCLKSLFANNTWKENFWLILQVSFFHFLDIITDKLILGIELN